MAQTNTQNALRAGINAMTNSGTSRPRTAGLMARGEEATAPKIDFSSLPTCEFAAGVLTFLETWNPGGWKSFAVGIVAGMLRDWRRKECGG